MDQREALVTPSVEGYYRIPAVWIGEEPDRRSVLTLNPAVHHAIAYEGPVGNSLKGRVQRDGLFLFEFGSWARAPMVQIPAYKPEIGKVLPKPVLEAQQKAEEIAIYRAQVMNAHQACLATAERIVAGRYSMMGFPINAWNTHKAWSLGHPGHYSDDTEDVNVIFRK